MEKLNTPTLILIACIVLAITLYFASTTDSGNKKIVCLENSNVIGKQFFYKDELYFKVPKKLGSNLYCKY